MIPVSRSYTVAYLARFAVIAAEHQDPYKFPRVFKTYGEQIVSAQIDGKVKVIQCFGVSAYERLKNLPVMRDVVEIVFSVRLPDLIYDESLGFHVSFCSP